jgi:hypothetical protein
VAALATAATIGWAAFEFHRKRIADLDERAAELRGVTLTYKLTKPRSSEVVEGAGVFSYEFSLHNPGRLPITRVNVDMRYPGPVRRVHSDRARTFGPEKTDHDMFTASVAAHDRHTWTRHLRVPIELWDQMRNTTARISFTAEDAGPVETSWPTEPAMPSRQLQKRLQLTRAS